MERSLPGDAEAPSPHPDGVVEERAAAVAAYRRARQQRDAARRDKDGLRACAEAHLSLFNQHAGAASVAHTLMTGDEVRTVEVDQNPTAGVGGLLWPSGQVLADLIAAGGLDLPAATADSVCCELGCGAAALPSLAFAGTRPGRVIATDTEEVLSITSSNVARAVAGARLKGELSLLPCDWSDRSAGRPKADVLLMADLLYAGRHYDDLIHTIDLMLNPDGGLLLMTFSRRIPALEQDFMSHLTSIGIDHDIVDSQVLNGETVVTIRGIRCCHAPGPSSGIYL